MTIIYLQADNKQIIKQIIDYFDPIIMTDYKNKLSSFNYAIEQEKQKVSLFESKLANNVYSPAQETQFTTPTKRSAKIIPNLSANTSASSTSSPMISTLSKTNTASQPISNNTSSGIKPSTNTNKIGANNKPSTVTSNNIKPSIHAPLILDPEAEQNARKNEILAKQQQQQERRKQELRRIQQERRRQTAGQEMRQQIKTLKEHMQALISSHNEQEQNRIKEQEERIKKVQKQRKERQQQQKRKQKQFEQFRRVNNELRAKLQQKATFIEMEYENESNNWKQQDQRYKEEIYKLSQKNEQKDHKIQQLIYALAQLREELKSALEKCEAQAKIIHQLREQNGALKQQNIEIKLENKNVKADNKVVISHLDKLLKEQSIDKEKTAREVFEQRQRRVIESLYSKTISTQIVRSPQNKKEEWLPSQRDELSNRVMYEKVLDEYKDHRQQCTRRIRQLENQVRVQQNQIQIQRRKVEVLQKNLQKLSDLRSIQKQSNHKRQKIIEEYKKQVGQLMDKNKKVEKVEEFYVIPRVKQKVGVISRLKKIPQL